MRRSHKAIYYLLPLLLLAPWLLGAKKPIAAAKPRLTPHLLADNSGLIRHLFLHFADYDIIPTLYGLLKNLPKETQLTIASPYGSRRALLETLIAEWPLQQRPQINIVGVDAPMTFWIRDDFVVGSGLRLILPKRFGIDALPVSFEGIAEKTKVTPVRSLIEFDGGNVVVSKEEVFVGYNVVTQNIGKIFNTETEIKNYLQAIFGKPVVFVGNKDLAVPHEHIDMILTPLPGRRLLLADPRLATTSLAAERQLLNSVYGKVYFNENTTPLPAKAKKLLFSTDDFVARLNDDLGVQSGGGTAAVNKDSDITLALLYAKNALPSNLRQFDLIEKDLRAKGFKEIYRIPVLMNHDIDNGPFITYNNMLIQNDGKKTTVFLPIYNIKPLDDLAVQTLSKLGYHVIPIDVQNISFYNGTLRCITQVLERSE